jgi:post-segregation antitoxin (ccd killing protein)
MSNKVKTTLTLNKDVIKRAKELNINMSAQAERGIIEYIHVIENLQREPSNFKKDNSKKNNNEGGC